MTTREAAARPPFWRDVRILRVLFQVAVLAIVLLILQYFWGNLSQGLRQLGLGLNFDFLSRRAGFAIGEVPIRYTPSFSYRRAYLVGLVNTLRVVSVGLVLASVLGLFAGIARLSSNWLVNKLAAAYVEIFRNTPLLVQLIFWYTAVLLQLPGVSQAVEVLGVAFLSVRGTAVPWVARQPGFWAWALVLLAGLVAAGAARRLLIRRSEATGQPIHVFWWSAALFLAVAAVGYLATGAPAAITVPEPSGFAFAGGATVTPEFTALLIGLVIYTGSFIAEIVRGSILAIQKGQTEAALALGLTNAQRLRLVVIPQALRILIPPLANQYLNLTKNSSLAFAVAYPDVFNVFKTIVNQSGQFVPMLAIIMGTYLAMSLLISAVSNLFNRLLEYPTR